MDALKTAAAEAVRAHADTLLKLSRRIHAHPELGYEEHRAAGWVAETLVAAGFDVERGVGGMPTALRARRGRGGLVMTFCAEYDALPGLGHACGHNLIAASAVGAAIGLAGVADAAGVTVDLLGTPAEEVGDDGGKVRLLAAGAFADSHAAMMVHPAPADVLRPMLIAAATFDVHFEGKAAHAAAFPELGINAADAMTVAQTAIGLLRQHLKPTDRVHGIVTHGGDAPNIVPARTSATWTIRASTLEGLEELRRRVMRCFEAGALASGARMTVSRGAHPYGEVVHDDGLSTFYEANARALGRTFVADGPLVERPIASTDMGNVSRVVPSIHPLIGINSAPAVNHQPEFAAHCVSPDAERAMIEGAIALAWTAVDAGTDVEQRARLLARDGVRRAG